MIDTFGREITPDDYAEMSRHLKEFGEVKLVFEFPPVVVLRLIGDLQLSLRHPANTGVTTMIARDVCNQMITRLANGDKRIMQLLQRGYDPQFDVPANSG